MFPFFWYTRSYHRLDARHRSGFSFKGRNLRFFFDISIPENETTMANRNVAIRLPSDAASYHREENSTISLWYSTNWNNETAWACRKVRRTRNLNWIQEKWQNTQVSASDACTHGFVNPSMPAAHSILIANNESPLQTQMLNEVQRIKRCFF
jgi:hypothetical protein